VVGLLRDFSVLDQFTQLVPVQPAGSKLPYLIIRGSFAFQSLFEHLGIEQLMFCVLFGPSVID
jgi:hypothetical protein